MKHNLILNPVSRCSVLHLCVVYAFILFQLIYSGFCFSFLVSIEGENLDQDLLDLNNACQNICLPNFHISSYQSFQIWIIFTIHLGADAEGFLAGVLLPPSGDTLTHPHVKEAGDNSNKKHPQIRGIRKCNLNNFTLFRVYFHCYTLTNTLSEGEVYSELICYSFLHKCCSFFYNQAKKKKHILSARYCRETRLSYTHTL